MTRSEPGTEPSLTVQHQRHPGRWVAAVLIAFLTVMLLSSMATNPRYQWDVVGHYLFDAVILRGLLNTVWLTVIAMVVGSVLGTVLAVFRLSPNPLLSRSIGIYVWLFRATPLLVQLLFWFNLGALYPELTVGVPWGPTLVSVPAGAVISVWTAALLGLSLHQAAYTAEIVRAIYARTYQTIPLLLVATLWYLALTGTLSLFQSMLEKRYGRGVGGRP
ncbi:MAG: ABC transporter permease subunit [Pseudonocardiaceae bacterium]|nr:ABC transporter permease subunit [Pseudonocardiaceae bacterium]